jgi:hypothetical protein
MKTPFIFRFQEPCVSGEGARVSAGTQTITNVRAEAMDSDPNGRCFEALVRQPARSGTMTRTAVAAEGSDEDRALSPQGLIPVEPSPMLGTQTMTKVLAEGIDQDPGGGRQFRVIPPCSLS